MFGTAPRSKSAISSPGSVPLAISCLLGLLDREQRQRLVHRLADVERPEDLVARRSGASARPPRAPRCAGCRSSAGGRGSAPPCRPAPRRSRAARGRGSGAGRLVLGGARLHARASIAGGRGAAQLEPSLTAQESLIDRKSAPSPGACVESIEARAPDAPAPPPSPLSGSAGPARRGEVGGVRPVGQDGRGRSALPALRPPPPRARGRRAGTARGRAARRRSRGGRRSRACCPGARRRDGRRRRRGSRPPPPRRRSTARG